MSFFNGIVLSNTAQAPVEKNGASLTYLIRTFGGPGSSPCWKSHHPKRLCWSWFWLLVVIPRLPHSPPLSGYLLPGTRGERVREEVVHRGEGSRFTILRTPPLHTSPQRGYCRNCVRTTDIGLDCLGTVCVCVILTC